MAVIIQSDPSHVLPVSPVVTSRWVATESPNNFRLVRKDYTLANAAEYASSPAGTALELSSEFTGDVGDSITVVDDLGNAYTGLVTVLVDSPVFNIVCDITWALFAGSPAYVNNNTAKDGYYFEGRLTVNGVVQALTIIASPNTAGVADVDVSGILRIMVALGKVGDYSSLLIAETGKSGSFTFAYRECWYASNEAYTEEGNTWYYVEAVRSVEQGSNLYQFVPDELQDAPFLNMFEQPVYFAGLPFDLSFLLPPQPVTSPPTELTVTIKRYNANNTLLNTSTTAVALTGLEGRVCSLNIDPASIEDTAAYMTAEITTP